MCLCLMRTTVEFALRFEDRKWCGCSVDLFVGYDVQVVVLKRVRVLLVTTDLRLKFWETKLSRSEKGHHEAGGWLFREESMMLKGAVY